MLNYVMHGPSTLVRRTFDPMQGSFLSNCWGRGSLALASSFSLAFTLGAFSIRSVALSSFFLLKLGHVLGFIPFLFRVSRISSKGLCYHLINGVPPFLNVCAIGLLRKMC